jgi:hypothetical protein
MSATALAIFVRLYTASGNRARWQNYYVGQTVASLNGSPRMRKAAGIR